MDYRNVGGQLIVQGDGSPLWNFGLRRDPLEVEAVEKRLAIWNGAAGSFHDLAPHLKGYGAGRTVMLHDVAKRIVGGHLQAQFQDRGTCFPAGTLVLMADGTQKAIETVAVGDSVVTHTGAARRVLAVGCRRHTGSLVTATVQGLPDTLQMTEEHPVAVYPNVREKGQHGYRRGLLQWTEAGLLAKGDRVLAPFGNREGKAETIDLATLMPQERLARVWKMGFQVSDNELRVKNGTKTIRRHLPVGPDLGRLIGLYLAEGCMELRRGTPTRITFTFASDEEMLVAETVALLKRLFGVDAKIIRSKLKTSVLRVRLANKAVACVFHALCPGNAYSKRVPDCILRADQATRLACLRGWLDGDGHMRADKSKGATADQTHCVLIGVTASATLAQTMWRLAVSCGIHPSTHRRKAVRVHTPAATSVNFYGLEAAKVYPERSGMAERSIPDKRPTQFVRADEGFLCKVKETSALQVAGLPVYNLEVEEDHSYVAGGIAVHNCVSRGMKRAADYCQCLSIMAGAAYKFAYISHAYIYGTCRQDAGQLSHEDGAIGAWAASSAIKSGMLRNEDCADDDNRDALAVEWGARGVPSEYRQKGVQHLIRKAVPIKSFDEARDFLCSGMGAITVASMVGYEGNRDKDGIVRRRGSWAHQMMFSGYRADVDALLQEQSWGPNNPQGPTVLDQPTYSFWTVRQDAESQIREGDTWGVTWVNAWPNDPEELTWRP